jgi:uncharacterized protein (TIGR02001 family)
MLIATTMSVSSVNAGGLKDDYVVPSSDKFEWSFNVGATTDYVFRGISQSSEDPVVQGGADVTYGLIYAGVWASGLDFGNGAGSADAEVDFYLGIKPTAGPVSFDLGVIYYAYPGAKDSGAELDYVELKFGASTSIQKFSFGATAFYSPEYTGNLGEAWTFEGTAGYELPSIMSITPTLSAVIGTTQFEQSGVTDYVYWNAGVSFLAAEKLTIDLRYWDTDLSSAVCRGPLFACDERFVATVKVSLP